MLKIFWDTQTMGFLLPPRTVCLILGREFKTQSVGVIKKNLSVLFLWPVGFSNCGTQNLGCAGPVVVKHGLSCPMGTWESRSGD